MSITFSEFKNDNPTKAGYFRIGYVVLANSPEDVLTGRVTNNERLTTLRGRNDMVKKTGQARWDVTVRWIAMLDDSAVSEDGRYQQWEDLRSILSMFYAAPFVEVENAYVRQALAEQDSSMASARMGFALRQLRINKHNDIVDALEISLTMTLFNYFPYSKDFGYQGDQGQSSDAWLSSSFKNYVEQWKSQNLDATKDTREGSPLLNWRDQIPGTMKFRWREYRTVKIGTMVSTDVTPAAVTAMNSQIGTPSTGKSTAGISGNDTYDSLIQKYAQQYGLSAAMVKAVMSHESSFSATAVGANFKNKACNAGTTINQVTSNLKSHIQTDADGGLAFVKQYVAQNGTPPDLGLMQLNWRTASALNSSLRPSDLFRAETNIALGCQYLSQLYSQGMTDNTIYWYNAGPDKSGKKNNATEQAYTQAVLSQYNKYAVVTPSSATQNTPGQQAPSTVTPSFVDPGTEGGNAPGDGLSAAQKQEVMNLINDGWAYDHSVNDVAFFYLEQQMSLTDNEHGDIANGYGLFPAQFSILFVNNIAQIPLAAYQYPTYQHIGSASSKISIGMMSKGTRDSEDQEPLHPGVTVLASASELLEAQYLRLRNTWRAVSSVHRMQAFYVENQLFNMLGIRGMTIDGINTSTLPNLADTVQVEVSGAQYENIFEVSSSYKINSIDSSSVSTAQSIVNSGNLSSLTSDEANTVTELSQFAQGRSTSNQSTLNQFLLKLGANSNAQLGTFSSLNQSNATQAQISAMMAPFASGGNGIGSYPAISSRLTSAQKAGQFTIGDCLLVSAITSQISNNAAVAAGAALAVSTLIPIAIPTSTPDTTVSTAQSTAQSLITNYGSSPAIQQTYDAIFSLLSSYDSSFATDINTIANSPKYTSQFTQALSPGGPGSDPINSGHGAYKDLGLAAISQNGADFNPGNYFFDHNADYLAEIRQNLDQVVQSSTQASNQVNKPLRPDSYDIAITESTYVGQNADTNSLVRMTNVPGYSMAEAFPTFKLFLMEDSSPGLIQAFDNFYSYASVLDIEIIRFMDKPDLARLQITNLANILQHKLFDNTLQGKYERDLNPFFSNTPSSDAGPVSGQDGTDAITTGKTASNQVYQLQQLSGFDLRDGVTHNKVERVPLQYAVLQPGTKIQVRMGYANNPDLLTPVFTGRVSRIEGDEILTIEAESYLAELCDLPTKDDKPVSNKKYGGWQPWHDSGDVASVVENLLKMDNAKHFGSFKLATISDPLVQGLTWQNRIGKMVGEFSLSPTNELARIGAAMTSSYDRSGENILINHVINHLGNASKQRLTRDFDDESTGFLDIYHQFDYKIPDNSTKTIWELIRDISRRYPEYLVLAKQYGFPFSADATMVVAHPLDWYFARLPMIGDAERYHASQTMDAEFTAWWNAQGKDAWDSMITQVMNDQDSLTRSAPAYPTNPMQFEATLESLRNTAVQFFGVGSFTSNETLNYVDQLLQSALNIVDSPTENSKQQAAIREIIEVRNLWDQFVEMQNPQSDDRLKPVRRYHFIDHQTIVHNGMTLNDKIYNAIRIGSDTASINGNIPSHYTRVLDVTDLLVDSKENVEPYSHIRRAVQQSFMKEEAGKMYRGEIILRGVPEIEPGDALVILDASTAIVGTVGVEKVIHSFSQETGFTTIVYPHCMTAVNEAASANLMRMFSMVMAKSLSGASLTGLVDNISQANKGTYVAAGAGVAAAAVTGAVGIALIGTPPGWVVDALISAAILGGILVTGYKSETTNMIEIMPVTRWGRPWIGGLEGYQISDVWQNIQNQFAAFKADNIYPLIDTYRYFKGVQTNTLPVTPPTN